MIQSNSLHRFLIKLLSAVLVVVSLQCSIAQAGMVSTETILLTESGNMTRERILSVINRDDARHALKQFGVSNEMVEKRVQAMTPEELTAFQQQLEEKQAGGNGFIAVVLFIFLILIILDLLGTTDIFPAIKPIQVN